MKSSRRAKDLIWLRSQVQGICSHVGQIEDGIGDTTSSGRHNQSQRLEVIALDHTEEATMHTGSVAITDLLVSMTTMITPTTTTMTTTITPTMITMMTQTTITTITHTTITMITPAMTFLMILITCAIMMRVNSRTTMNTDTMKKDPTMSAGSLGTVEDVLHQITIAVVLNRMEEETLLTTSILNHPPRN